MVTLNSKSISSKAANMVTLVSLIWPSPLKFPGEIPAKFEPSVSTYYQLSTFFRSDSIVSFLMYFTGAFLALTLPAIAWIFLYSRRNNKIKVSAADLGSAVNANSPERRARVGPIADDAFSVGIIREVVSLTPGDIAHGDELTIDDDAYAEELQFQETLIASMLTSKTLANNPSSSVQGPIVDSSKHTNLEIAENSSESFCGICLENKESWLMFANDMCDHSFCYECTASHIVAKIQDKVKDIGCPAPSCNVVLDSDACRLMIPDDALVEWDELLCTSLIPESQKMYCPFRDCSALLVNEFGEENIEGVKCVVCSRWFCAQCRVPWHADFTCKEFKKLYAKKGGKVDKIVKELAKKKSWQKCPKCKMYVEKTEGCVHITCRCKHEFCYRCGSKWSENHGSCRRKN